MQLLRSGGRKTGNGIPPGRHQLQRGWGKKLKLLTQFPRPLIKEKDEVRRSHSSVPPFPHRGNKVYIQLYFTVSAIVVPRPSAYQGMPYGCSFSSCDGVCGPCTSRGQ
jgi:hypothetical protein